MLPLVILMFWIGLYPRPYLNLMEPTVKHYVGQMQEQPESSPAQPGATRYQRSRRIGLTPHLAAQTEGR